MFRFGLRTLLGALTMIALIVALVTNDRQWRQRHEEVSIALRRARQKLRAVEKYWTPEYVRTRITAIAPNGRGSSMSLHWLSGSRSPANGGGMLECDQFGSVYCRYLRTIDNRDLYEVFIGPGIKSMSSDENGTTPGIVVKYVSFQGEPVVVMDERGYRVVMENFDK